MSFREEILSRFETPAAAPLYLPDLTLWHATHAGRDTLPEKWRSATLPQIAAALGAPVWSAIRPWRMETPGIDVETSEEEGQRITQVTTPAGTLISRWSLGSEGSWWQTEYPVKTAADLDAARAWVEARVYRPDPSGLEEAEVAVGDAGVLALEIPTRPYADLLYDLLGMSEGYMLLMEDPPALRDCLAILEEKLQACVAELAGLPGDLCYSPDNLDGQFVYPTVFAEFMADSYRHTTDTLHRAGKRLLVHAGGPVGQLLAPLVEAGVDGVEGIAPPPQSDASLDRARELAGPDMLLWGGIPQDFLLSTRTPDEFETAVIDAVHQARADGRALLGVADRVPADAELDRLEALASLIARALAAG